MSNTPTHALAAYAVLLQLADDRAHADRAWQHIDGTTVPNGFASQLATLEAAIENTREQPPIIARRMHNPPRWPLRPSAREEVRVDWRGDTYPPDAIPGVDLWNGWPIPGSPTP